MYIFNFLYIQNELKNEHNGKVLVTCDVIFFGGWCPCKTQQAPLKPSKPKVSLKDLLNSENNQAVLGNLDKDDSIKKNITSADGHRYGMSGEELDELLKKNDHKKD